MMMIAARSIHDADDKIHKVVEGQVNFEDILSEGMDWDYCL